MMSKKEAIAEAKMLEDYKNKIDDRGELDLTRLIDDLKLKT